MQRGADAGVGARTVWGLDCEASYPNRMTEFIQEVSPLLPNPFHLQNHDQSMSQLSTDDNTKGFRLAGARSGARVHLVPLGAADGAVPPSPMCVSERENVCLCVRVCERG